ncbi:uncharacterized protein LOC131661819 isoform X1 [Vicia villosa]|uniref:uncharacterized protein LOC131661819 isoform X1 n=1 Tax=Vicia villosa TaxID=3911 RepID=UPI00273CC24B|nr:uncharacterized protein LOC131661819 isoform X1 [Vicia villosa]
MPIDKSWIDKSQDTLEYENGLINFLNFAFHHKSIDGLKIKCPCSKCGFKKWGTWDEVYVHLKNRPFPKNYKVWNWHGERSSIKEPQVVERAHVTEDTFQPQNTMENMVHDAFGFTQSSPNNLDPSSEHNREGRNSTCGEDKVEFFELLKDVNQPLYEGCTNYSKLSFLIKLYHIKCLCGVSDKAMTMIIELLKDVFVDAKIPVSFYEAKKIINKLRLDYTKIDACPNDCMLYWGEENQDFEECKRCKTSRWKDDKKKKSAKILRYFPLKPRLQRLFMCSKTAESMRWHALEANQDGMMRHPRDSEAWKTFDLLHPEFATDSRNVRLGLATDGFNPFGVMSTNYSIWPVVLIPYNRPPWECMKHTSTILSMIIPGKQAPGNNIDVYLQPLIKELKELWYDGVQTLDLSKNEIFMMKAALMWTISDFPGLGTLSGWNTHTKLACPTCNNDTENYRLKKGGKWCFMGHRRFLEKGHKFRLSRSRFNGKVELRDAPATLSGLDILNQLKGVNVAFGKVLESKDKDGGKRKRKKKTIDEGPRQWRKKSIFFDLPYWDSNLLRHNLDVMHIEKNVCDNVVYTLLNETGKSKDNLKAREDLKLMGIRKDLWPDSNKRFRPSLFTMSNSNKDIFLQTLKNTIFPDGYSSNISRCVDINNRKLFGMKSHDCHVLMEQILPIAIRNVLPDNVTAVLVELCSFFRQLCAKSLSHLDLDRLQSRIILTLCHLEMLFPPSFFTIMVHLTCHLVGEAKLGGPVHYRWMYPIERYLGHLKSYVRNKAQPEGSIAEGYLAEEVLTFCSQYIDDIETRINRPSRVDDYPDERDSSHRSTIFPPIGRAVGAFSTFDLSTMEKTQAHRYVLLNCPQVKPYIDEFKEYLRIRSKRRRQSTTEIEKMISKDFIIWFPQRIMNPDISNIVSDDLKYLAKGPTTQARRYSAFNINGFKFRTLAREHGLKTQNSGVYLTSSTSCVSSSVDTNFREADLLYYGKLEDIIELNYYGRFKVTLFKCKWADTTRDRGYKKDAWGFSSVNFSRSIHTGDREEHDPYIEASQAQMVYYVNDEIDKDWSVVVNLKPRDLYDMGDQIEIELCPEQNLDQFFGDFDDLSLIREDVDDELISEGHVNDEIDGDELMSE